MKRKQRKTEEFEPFELFADVGREYGYELNAVGDIHDFQDRIGKSLKAAQQTSTVIYGKHAEKMFAHVVGALGQCRLIKQEDAGALFVNEIDVELPDYRIVLTDGTTYLIEVKNCRTNNLGNKFKIEMDYLSKLEAYASLNKIPLKIAVYFSSINNWVLLSKSSLDANGKYFHISVQKAIAHNEMFLLGDLAIATPSALRIDFLGNPTECSAPDANGQVVFTIRDTRIYSRDTEVTDSLGKAIAWYLIRYGEWIEVEKPILTQEGGKVVGFSLVFAPLNLVEGQLPQVMGTLSSMISKAFKELTSRTGTVIAVDVKNDPGAFSPVVPENYKGSLPLWQFSLRPKKYTSDK